MGSSQEDPIIKRVVETDRYREVESKLRPFAGKDSAPGVFDWHRGGNKPPHEEISNGVFRLTWDGLPDGVFYLPSFLTFDEQIRVARASLEEYIEPPNRRNLDAHEGVDQRDLQTLWRSQSPQLSKLRWSTLDDVESANTRPLVSLSLGLPAVFLLGGTTRSIKPEGLLLRSGDVLVLTGDARLLYHGVPCVLRDSKNIDVPSPNADDHISSARADGWGFPRLSPEDLSTDDDSIISFLRKTRVNLSIREVANADGSNSKPQQETAILSECRKRSRENE